MRSSSQSSLAARLGPRLAAIAELALPGLPLADIGTDHGRLPTALVLAGRVPWAVASDRAAPPLVRAQATIARAGAADRVRVRLGEGLATLAAGEVERVKMVTEKAAEAIRGALGLADEDSVASAIRSMQLVNKIPKELRGKMSEFADNPEQMQRIYEHDYAVRELARVVGNMHGERPIPLAQEIAQAKEQAALGARDVWRLLVERAQDAAALSAEAGEMSLAEIESVAASLAAFPTTWTGCSRIAWFAPSGAMTLASGLGRTTWQTSCRAASWSR